jgi:pimeloyl-ACP methyl ester carboxylesterase
MPQVLGNSGPAVLLLPGGAEAAAGFFPGLVEGLLADPGCRVILYDRPGAGASDVDGGLADASDAIHAMIHEGGIGPVVAIGQSLGGAVAVLLAADHPEDVAGLVLLDPTPITDPELAKKVASRTRTTVKLFGIPVIGGMLRALLRASAKRSARRHDMSAEAAAAALTITELDVPKLGRAVVGMEQISKRLDLSSLPRVPAIVITADRKPGDAILRAHEKLADALDAPLLCWPGAQHQVHLTHPVEVLEASRAVVREVAVA